MFDNINLNARGRAVVEILKSAGEAAVLVGCVAACWTLLLILA